jgi:CBS domain-containing protein
MSLLQFCRKPVVKVAPERSIAETCRLMQEKNVGWIVVENSGKLAGIITDRDIALKVAGAARDPFTTKVGEIMSPDPIRISVERDLQSLNALLHAYHVRRIPIVDNSEKVVGIVTLDDLIGLLGDEMSEIGKALAEELAYQNDKDKEE